MKQLIAILIVCAAVGMALAWTGLEADGQKLILKAPDGHCAQLVLSNINVITAETMECP
jgi:hypothetical protein